MNMSEKHKAFLWMLPRTGSVHTFHVFALFDFRTYRHNEGNLISMNTLRHNHVYEFPPNNHEYTFICTARNPFTRLLSIFKHESKDPYSWNPKNFRKFLSKHGEPFFSDFFYPYGNRQPDFFLRIESLWHDYNNIPFIRDSKFNKSGALYEFCQSKVNETDNLIKPNEYYTPDMIDYLLTKGRKYFETLNYSYPF